jgi:hypothetical protein
MCIFNLYAAASSQNPEEAHDAFYAQPTHSAEGLLEAAAAILAADSLADADGSDHMLYVATLAAVLHVAMDAGERRRRQLFCDHANVPVRFHFGACHPQHCLSD